MLMRHLTFNSGAASWPPAAVWNNCQLSRKDWQPGRGRRREASLSAGCVLYTVLKTREPLQAYYDRFSSLPP